MSVIVQSSPSHYGPSMTAALLRLMMLFALALVPFGMAGAPAMAQPVPANHAMAQAGHCDEQSDQDKAPSLPSQKAHCALCAALPASPPPTTATSLRPKAPRLIATVSPFDGIELEIATPPPKSS